MLVLPQLVLMRLMCLKPKTFMHEVASSSLVRRRGLGSGIHGVHTIRFTRLRPTLGI